MTLRTALRDHLRPEHDRLDKALGALDLTKPNGLAIFLKCHLIVWGRLQTQGTIARQILAIRIEALRQDLAVLNRGRVPLDDKIPVGDLAILYMAFGAQMGMALLCRQWAESPDAQMRSAYRFMTLCKVPGAWQALCSSLEGYAVHTLAAQNVLTDTRRIYHLFDAAFQKCRDSD